MGIYRWWQLDTSRSRRRNQPDGLLVLLVWLLYGVFVLLGYLLMYAALALEWVMNRLLDALGWLARATVRLLRAAVRRWKAGVTETHSSCRRT